MEVTLEHSKTEQKHDLGSTTWEARPGKHDLGSTTWEDLITYGTTHDFCDSVQQNNIPWMKMIEDVAKAHSHAENM